MNPLIKIGAVIAAVVILILYGISGITSIDPGIVGLKIKMLGSDRGKMDTISIGTTWIEPFSYDVTKYDARTKQYPEEKEIPSGTKDGQPVIIDASLEIGLDSTKIPTLHTRVGSDWYTRVVLPAFRAEMRNAPASYLSDEAYTGIGRRAIQEQVQANLAKRYTEDGIRIVVNMRALQFTNKDYVNTLEEKAKAAQKVIIEQRNAEAAAQSAIKVANNAEGEKQKTIKGAEGEREKQRLEGEGERLKKEQQAKGILAIKLAEAEGARVLTAAYAGAGARYVAQIEWARNLGPNVKVWGVPTGAPGTSSLMDINGILQGAFKPKE